MSTSEWHDKTVKRKNLYMYSGAVSYPDGSPTIMDIAISLSREGRYAGAGIRWWPVALHTMAVCDLLEDDEKIHGWMHDTPECIGGDRPKPAKTDEDSRREEELLIKLYQSLDVPFPTDYQRTLVHEADQRVLHGEVYTVGTQALQQIYPRDPEAEDIVLHYMNEYTYADCLEAGGRCPIEFMKRFREYKNLIT